MSQKIEAFICFYFFVMTKGGISYLEIKQENDKVDIKILCKLPE